MQAVSKSLCASMQPTLIIPEGIFWEGVFEMGFLVLYSTSSAGTKYLFVGRLYEPRPSYRFLGVLMCIQLAISAGSWALSQTRLSQQDELDEETGSKAAASLQKAVVLKVG